MITLALGQNFPRGYTMASKKTWDTISVIYDNVHYALWAMLVSFVLYFVTIVAPNIPAAQAHIRDSASNKLQRSRVLLQ